MYALQSRLPRLPVPQLAALWSPLRSSLEPVLRAPDLKRVDEKAAIFFEDANAGQARQVLLEEYASSKPNWLEELWDGGYLSFREPLPVAMNYYLQIQTPPEARSDQVELAARLVEGSLEFYQQVVSESFPIEKGMCMGQFARVFGYARIARPESDKMMCFESAPKSLEERHFATEFISRPDSRRQICVLCAGSTYTVEVIGEDGQVRDDIRASLRSVWADATAREGEHVAGVTALPRDEVAAWRLDVESGEYGGEMGGDLERVDSALFVLCLDAETGMKGPWGGRDGGVAQSFIHGYKAGDRWFDKHLLIVQPDGTAGLLLEHAQGDGTTILPWLDAMHNAASSKPSTPLPSTTPTQAAGSWSRLFDGMSGEWQQRADAVIDGFWDSLECHVLRTDGMGGLVGGGGLGCVGKEEIKAARLAPDATVQLAMQVAQFRRHGFLVPSYESASTRGFLHGRTETIRSATSAAFRAASLLNSFDPSCPESIAATSDAIEVATETHTAITRAAVNGHGVDRHLLGLRAMETLHNLPKDPFLHDEALLYASQWRLSTSNCGSSSTQLFGFGPVVPNGYGVGYQIHDHFIAFSIASFNPPTPPTLDTSAPHFAVALEEALHDILAVRHMHTTLLDSDGDVVV